MITRNGQEPLFPIQGTKLLTDQKGIDQFATLWSRYEGKPMVLRPKLRQEISELYIELKRERRLYRDTGEPLL